MSGARGLFVALMSVALMPQAQAQTATPLRGELFIAGKTAIDPPPNEPKSSHAYMTLTGPAALRMYRAMHGKEEANACESGKKLKRAGALSCSITADGKTATCDFALDMIKGTLDDGRPC